MSGLPVAVNYINAQVENLLLACAFLLICVGLLVVVAEFINGLFKKPPMM